MEETIDKKKYVVKTGFGDGDCLPVFETEDPKEAYRKAWDLAYENQCVTEAAEERYEMFDTDEDRYPHEPVSDEDRYRFDLPAYIKCYDELEDYYDRRNRVKNSWEVNIEFDGYTLCGFNQDSGDRHPWFGTDGNVDHGYPFEGLQKMMTIYTMFREHYNGYKFRKGVEYQYRYIWRERVRGYGEDHGYRMTNYNCDYSLLPELKLPSDDELAKEYYRGVKEEWFARRALEGYNVEADFNCMLCSGMFRKI